MSNLKVLINGIVKENPTFVLLLGMCPTLGTTSSAINGMGMGLATMFVLICSNFAISAIKNLVPDMVRIPIFVVVTFACKNTPVASFFDGLGIGLGFTIALTLLGGVREFLGTGKLFNIAIMPEQYGMLVFVLAPGAFIALGYLIAIVNRFKKA